MTVACVSGASGMLGGRLVERLHQEGLEIRALLRPTSQDRWLRRLPIDIVRAESDDGEALKRAVIGADLLFHTAGYIDIGSTFDVDEPDEKYRQANVDFTRLLLEASLEAGVARFIHISSGSVYAPDYPFPLTEDAPLAPFTAYGRSKLEAETLVLAYQERGLPATIIRPTLIYGPRDRHLLPTGIKLARVPILPLVDGGVHYLDLVYVDDVVDLAWRASQSEAAERKIYNAGCGKPLRLHEYFEILGGFEGFEPRIVAASPHLSMRLRKLAGFYLSLTAPGAEVLLSASGIRLMSQDVHFDMTRAENDLGPLLHTSFREGLAATLAADRFAPI